MLFWTLRIFLRAGTTVFAAACAACLCGTLPACADVSLPALIAENMVVQQKTPVHIYGTAAPGEKVSVSLVQSVETTANESGNWEVFLPAVKAGGPYTLTVKGNNTLTVPNVFSGEVWVCSGQSNMERTLSSDANASDAIARSANSNIHLFHVAKKRSDTPQTDVKGTWQMCGPETVASFSAVGYYFGRDLQKDLNVPIGLIESDWGGTPAEAWTSEPFLTQNSRLKPLIDDYPAKAERYQKAVADYPEAKARAQADNKPVPPAPRKPWRYSELYNAMIAPLTKYPVRGATWYQGESNTGRAEQYKTLLPALIENWRQAWGIKSMPFLVVQLAPFANGNAGGTSYAELREAQNRTAQSLPNVGIAVITDVGNEKDIHPKRKEPVGARLALLARQIAYQEKVAAQSPTFRSMSVKGNEITVRFDNVGDGLFVRAGETSGADVAPGVLSGFTIAGDDGKFVPAVAALKGRDLVVVHAGGVEKPVAVRYGFVNFPIVNLWGNGLPANPFRSDSPKAQP